MACTYGISWPVETVLYIIRYGQIWSDIELYMNKYN